jgi:hypothetical protein
MADFYSAEAPAAAAPTVKRSANAVGSKVRRTISTFTCDATGPGGAAAGTRLMLPTIPKGARGVHFIITASATMGAAATFALGITGNTGKYRAAAVITAVETPETVRKTAFLAAELAADETPFLTTAVAAMVNGGEKLVVETIYSLGN